MEDPESGEAGKQPEQGRDDQVGDSEGCALSRNHGHGVRPPHHGEGVGEVAGDRGEQQSVHADVDDHLEPGGIGQVF